MFNSLFTCLKLLTNIQMSNMKNKKQLNKIQLSKKIMIRTVNEKLCQNKPRIWSL